MNSNRPNKSKAKKITTVILSIALLLGTFGAGFLVRGLTYEKEIDTINYILSMYRKHYYDEQEDIISIFENALLDQYSDYLTAEENRQSKSQSQGNRQGIGVSIDGSCKIVRVAWNSPSEQAGIKLGDIITAVSPNNDSSMITVNNTDEFLAVFSEVPDSTPFTIRISRQGDETDITLMREQYIETFVRYFDSTSEFGFNQDEHGGMNFVKMGKNTSYDLRGETGIAVIQYLGFDGLKNGLYGSAGQFIKALEEMKASGIKRLIIDLRNNGGGYLNILTEISAHLVDAIKNSSVPISVAKYKNEDDYIFKSGKVVYSDYNFESIIFLVNSGTASASEALVGAVLDYDQKNIAKVVIEPFFIDGKAHYRSFGKGIMQTTYDRFTGEAIKLTTAKIFWPTSGVTIHDIGITTDLNDKLYSSNPKIFNAGSSGAVYDSVSLSK